MPSSPSCATRCTSGSGSSTPRCRWSGATRRTPARWRRPTPSSLNYSPVAGAGREEAPEEFTGVAAREVERNAAGELLHGAAHLEQPQPQRVELHPGHAGGGEPAAQGIEEPVGGGVQQQAKLVGPEAMVAEAVGEAGVLQVLDPALDRAPVDVPIVEGGRRVGLVGDD